MLCTLRIKEMMYSGQRLSVHSVYRHTVNLKAGNQLIALHPDFIELTPLSAALPFNEAEFEKFALYAQEQTGFSWNCGYLVSDNGLRWKTGEMQTWNAQLQVQLEQKKQQHLAEKLREFLFRMGDGGMSNAAISAVGKDDSLVTSVLRKQVWKILQAPSFSRVSAVMELVGMGQGLTPSGDDFIVGLLLSYYVAKQDSCKKELEELRRAVIKNLSCTNDVSRQYLICACEGEFGIKLHRLIKECDKEIQIKKNLEHIKKTGHSSGIDTLNGISVGLSLLQKNEF